MTVRLALLLGIAAIWMYEANFDVSIQFGVLGASPNKSAKC